MTIRFSAVALAFSLAALVFAQNPAPPAPTVVVGKQAPAFKFKDQSGKDLNLAELTAKGPVLVRLTCGCLGCDKELPYFQEIDAAYKKAGLTSVAIFKEADAKVAKYAQDKKITSVGITLGWKPGATYLFGSVIDVAMNWSSG